MRIPSEETEVPLYRPRHQSSSLAKTAQVCIATPQANKQVPRCIDRSEAPPSMLLPRVCFDHVLPPFQLKNSPLRFRVLSRLCLVAPQSSPVICRRNYPSPSVYRISRNYKWIPYSAFQVQLLPSIRRSRECRGACKCDNHDVDSAQTTEIRSDDPWYSI